MASFPLILAVNPAAGFTSAAQFLDAVRRSPGKYSYASPGAGSPHHLAMELLEQRTGSFIVHVPYRATAPAMQDVMSGQVPIMVVDTAAIAARPGAEIRKAILAPEVKARPEAFGLEVAPGDGAQLAAFIQKETRSGMR